MRTKFYEQMLNSIDKIPTVTLEEKNDKSDAIITLTHMIGKRGGSVKWNGKKWVVKAE